MAPLDWEMPVASAGKVILGFPFVRNHFLDHPLFAGNIFLSV